MQAVEANDDEPQAYVDYAIVLGNAQRFEAAIDLFQGKLLLSFGVGEICLVLFGLFCFV
jgi:hypothetical protein